MPRKRDERTSARNHDVYKLQRIISARGRRTQKNRKGKRDEKREEGDGAERYVSIYWNIPYT